MKRVFSICEEHGIVPPKCNNLGNGFEVVLFKGKLKDHDTDNRINKILLAIKNNSKISIANLSRLNSVSKSTALRYIKILKEKEIIRASR